MPTNDTNSIVVVGNLTRDPELRATPSGTSICGLRIASNTLRKKGDAGEYEERPNYFDVTVFGTHGENCARYLNKGRKIVVDGRLEWREWESPDGHHREAVSIVADSVQFLSPPPGAAANGTQAAGATAEAVGVAGEASGELDF